MKKTVIRVGDTVKVLRCNFVRRVGYPLVWYDLKEEVRKDPRTAKAWEALTGRPAPAAGDKGTSGLLALPLLDSEDWPFPREFIEFVARMRVEERSFGGNERTLHYRKVDRACLPPCATTGYMLIGTSRFLT